MRMRIEIKKNIAFNALSLQAQLYIKLSKSTTDQERFMHCVRYATNIANRKSLGTVDKLNTTNLKVIMQLIQSYLDSGVDPDTVQMELSALFYAITFPELVNLLLMRGANPNFQNTSLLSALHLAAQCFDSLYQEKLFITAELLAAAGANIHAKDERGRTPVELIRKKFNLSEKQINEVEVRFKQITEHPRESHEICSTVVEQSPYSELQLTERDNINIRLYREKKYDELINLNKTKGITQFWINNRNANQMSEKLNYPRKIHTSLTTVIPHDLNSDTELADAALCKLMRASAGELTQDDLFELNRPISPVIPRCSSYYSDDSDNEYASPSPHRK